jgi:hypothetical protein
MVESAAHALRRSPRAESRSRADGLAGLVETAFTCLARARSARAFHPVGSMFAGTVAVDSPESRVGSVLAGHWPVQVRASKGVGTPEKWPDFHGLALRIDHSAGPVDLLFTTVGRRIPYMIAPSVGWCTHPYTTFLPYSVDDERLLIRLEPDQPDAAPEAEPVSVKHAVSVAPVTFTVLESEGTSWRRVGKLTIAEPSDEDLAFDPVINQHPSLCHSRLFAGFRLWAYVGSRRGRGATVAELNRKTVPAASVADAR